MEPLLPDIRAVLTTTPTRWLSWTTTLSPATLAQPPAPGEWSAADCLGHLLQTEQDVFPQRLQHFLAGEDLAAFTPAPTAAGGADLSLAERAVVFAHLRTRNLALIDSLTPADLARSAQHPDLGRVTLGELLHTWAAHDLNHTMQAERAVLQPFIAGSGAWRSRFAALVLPAPA